MTKQVRTLKTQVLHNMNFLMQHLVSLPMGILHKQPIESSSKVSLKYSLTE